LHFYGIALDRVHRQPPDQQSGCFTSSNTDFSTSLFNFPFNFPFQLLIERTMTRRAVTVTKEQLIEEFNAVVAETEQLLKSVAKAGGQNAGALSASVEQSQRQGPAA
jgi:hypothetical protein